jgi:hypothetical protein
MSSERRDPHDGEYIGNIFGRRLTIISAIIVFSFAGFALYRHLSLGVPFGLDDPDAMETSVDSLDLQRQKDTLD